MGGQVTLTATLTAGPPSVGGSSLPSGATSIPFGLSPEQKSYIDSINFDLKKGIGAAPGPVTQGHTLYARTTTPMLVRLTFANPNGADIVSVLPSNGVLVLEPAAASGYYLKLVEAQGAGSIEFWCGGSQ